MAQDSEMIRPSITLPTSIDEEITERRAKGSNRSKYIREALLMRFALEDAGEWPEDLESMTGNTPPDEK